MFGIQMWTFQWKCPTPEHKISSQLTRMFFKPQNAENTKKICSATIKAAAEKQLCQQKQGTVQWSQVDSYRNGNMFLHSVHFSCGPSWTTRTWVNLHGHRSFHAEPLCRQTQEAVKPLNTSQEAGCLYQRSWMYHNSSRNHQLNITVHQQLQQHIQKFSQHIP